MMFNLAQFLLQARVTQELKFDLKLERPIQRYRHLLSVGSMGRKQSVRHNDLQPPLDEYDHSYFATPKKKYTRACGEESGTALRECNHRYGCMDGSAAEISKHRNCGWIISKF